MSEEELDQPRLSDADFRIAFARLNAFFGLGLGWQTTTAIKRHVDEFGIAIRRGDDYFKRTDGNNVSKLSRRSMDKVLYMTMHMCATMEHVGDLLLKKQRDQLFAVRDRRDRIDQ